MVVQITRNDPRRLSRGGGFSLIELIAVMIVVGILAAAVAPVLSATASTRAAMAARHLVRDLTFARQRAVATGTRSWVVFDTAADTWSVLAEDPNSPGRINAAVLTDPATSGPFVQSLGVNQFVGVQLVTAAFDGNDEIGFDWLGRPLNQTEAALAAQGSVTLSGSHVVTVEVGSGFVAYAPP